MSVFLDNSMIASSSVPRGSVGGHGEQQFHIAVRGMPVTVDELRFSSGALKPEEFLTEGKDHRPAPGPGVANNGGGSAAPAPEGETPMRRLDRLARERRAREKAEREARRREEEAKRRQ